jgi:hypothetical protein
MAKTDYLDILSQEYRELNKVIMSRSRPSMTREEFKDRATDLAKEYREMVDTLEAFVHEILIQQHVEGLTE